MSPLEVIESQYYIWLVGLSEPSQNELTITVSPTLYSETMVGIPFVDGIPLDLPGRIFTPDESIEIDITFDTYLLQSV